LCLYTTLKNHLKRCLDSIINQSYRDIEIIVIDDGSTDSSNKICKEYALIDNRIKVVTTKNFWCFIMLEIKD